MVGLRWFNALGIRDNLVSWLRSIRILVTSASTDGPLLS